MMNHLQIQKIQVEAKCCILMYCRQKKVDNINGVLFSETLHMTSEGLGEMIEGDFADTSTENFRWC